MIRTVIADTQKSSVLKLKELLLSLPDFTVVPFAEDKSLLKQIFQISPDFLFLDIHMFLGSADDFFSPENAFDSFPSIVFLTESDTPTVNILKKYSFPFFQKPLLNVTRQKLQHVIEMISSSPRKSINSYKLLHQTLSDSSRADKDAMAVYDANGTRFIPYRNINYIYESEGSTCISTGNNTYTSSQSLYETELELPPFFVRIHQRYIVNIHRITSIQPWFNGNFQINISGTANQLPLSRPFVDSFKKISHFI